MGKGPAVVMANCGPTTSVNETLAVLPAESLTAMERTELPAMVGCPAIVPVVESARPLGSVPEASDQVRPVPEPPVAANVTEYGEPT